MSSQVVAFGEVCEFIRGVSFDASEVQSNSTSGYVPILRAGNIGDTLDTLNDLVFVPAQRVSEEQFLRPGDIAICMSSGSPEVVGKTAQLTHHFTGSVGVFCGIIRPRNQEQSSYTAHWLRSSGFMRWRDSQARGANIQNLRFSQLEEIEFPLLPLTEQHRIAALLDRAEKLRRARRYAAQLSETYLPSVFIHLFGDPGRNTKRWDVIEIDEILDKSRVGIRTGPFGSSLKRSEYVEQGIPVWGIDNVRPNEFVESGSLFITEAKFSELLNYSVDYGDVLISRAGTVGRMCVAKPTMFPSIIGSNLLRVALDKSRVLPEYFTALFTHFMHKVGQLKMSSDENAYSFINPTILHSMTIPVPPLALQEKFARVVQQFERLRAQQREAERQTERLFQTLLHRAFAT